MMNPKSDVQIQNDVRDELLWDPEVTITDIGVTVKDGQVTLRGSVEMYGEKWAAERDARRISGVRALTNEITVTSAKSTSYSDTDTARHVADALLFDWSVPKSRVQAKVSDGWVTLSGTTDWQYQRAAAEADARRIAGVKGVDNDILIVQPHVSASEIQAGITQALVRTAEVDASRITVAVDGARVTLTGRVRSWAEYDAALNASWRAKGVTNVINDIVVQA
jgi:osmotically-inducible protein OsmY